eukprot:scaffold76134_cov62-Phaeocystis_antarctica.AAC.4
MAACSASCAAGVDPAPPGYAFRMPLSRSRMSCATSTRSHTTASLRARASERCIWLLSEASRAASLTEGRVGSSAEASGWLVVRLTTARSSTAARSVWPCSREKKDSSRPLCTSRWRRSTSTIMYAPVPLVVTSPYFASNVGGAASALGHDHDGRARQCTLVQASHRAGAALHAQLRDGDMKHLCVCRLELGAEVQLGAPVGACARVDQHEVRVVVVERRRGPWLAGVRQVGVAHLLSVLAVEQLLPPGHLLVGRHPNHRQPAARLCQCVGDELGHARVRAGRGDDGLGGGHGLCKALGEEPRQLGRLQFEVARASDDGDQQVGSRDFPRPVAQKVGEQLWRRDRAVVGGFGQAGARVDRAGEQQVAEGLEERVPQPHHPL